MNRAAWGRPVSSREAYRRAGGRRGYNARRTFMVRLRWARLLDLARELEMGIWEHGAAARLARALGVSRWTVARDIRQIRATFNHQHCPVCASPILHLPRSTEDTWWLRLFHVHE
jgi:hypothetical protein